MPQPSAHDGFVELLRAAVHEGTLVKLTLGKYRGAEPTLKNVFVRPVTLQAGPHLAFVWRHATRDVTKNHPPGAALHLLEPLIGGDFLDAHLFTTTQSAQFESKPDGTARIKVIAAAPVSGAMSSPSSSSDSAQDRKSTRLNSSHSQISYAVFCLKKKKN